MSPSRTADREEAGTHHPYVLVRQNKSTEGRESVFVLCRMLCLPPEIKVKMHRRILRKGYQS